MNKLSLTDEEQFNLGFTTSYKATSPELFAYSEGVFDGAKAQLTKAEPIIRADERAKTLREVGEWLENYVNPHNNLSSITVKREDIDKLKQGKLEK